jgi:hypothetical protein
MSSLYMTRSEELLLLYGQIKHLYDTEKLKNMQQKDKQDKPQVSLSDNSIYLLLDDMRI